MKGKLIRRSPSENFWQLLAELLRSLFTRLKETRPMTDPAKIERVVTSANHMAEAARNLGTTESDKAASDETLAAAQVDNQAKANAVESAEAAVTAAETEFEAAIEDLKAGF
jgi:hypothetical protein